MIRDLVTVFVRLGTSETGYMHSHSHASLMRSPYASYSPSSSPYSSPYAPYSPGPRPSAATALSLHDRSKCQKVSSQVNLPYDIAVELTLDNVYLCRRGVSSVKSRYEESRYKSGYEGYKSSHLYSSENSRYISGNLSPHSSSANLSPPYQDPARSAYILSPRRSSARPSSSGNSPLIFP